MRVLQLIQQPQLRGAEIFACQLSCELQALGVATDVLCLFNSGEGLKQRFPQLNFIDLQAVRTRRLFDRAGLRRLKQIIVEGGYDVVQANAGDTLKYAALSKALFGWKAKLVFRNANKLTDFLRGRLHAAFVKWTISRCDHVISVSEFCRQDLIGLSADIAGKSTTISIGTYINPALAIKTDPESPVFINIGSFVPEKNHQFLIRAFAKFVGQHKTGSLVLIGDGKLKKEIQKECERLGVTDRVGFRGYLSAPWDAVPSATAMVVPSTIEGLPAVILEAMAARVPVIAAAVGGIPELIQNEGTGFCIAGYEENSYVAAMERLRSDAALRKRIADQAFAEIERSYLMPEIGGKFKSLYTTLLNGANG